MAPQASRSLSKPVLAPISFVFKEPFKIQENLKAIKELKKSVKFHFNMKHFLEN